MASNQKEITWRGPGIFGENPPDHEKPLHMKPVLGWLPKALGARQTKLGRQERPMLLERVDLRLHFAHKSCAFHASMLARALASVHSVAQSHARMLDFQTFRSGKSVKVAKVVGAQP